MDSRTIPQEDLYANQNGIEGQEDQQSQTSREFDPEKSETIWCKHCGNNVPGRRDRTSACNLCGNTLVNIAAGQSQASGNIVRRSVQSEKRNARDDFMNLSDALGIGDERDYVIDMAALCFTTAVDKNFTTRHRTELVKASCLYLTCREKNLPFLLIDFSSYLDVSIYELGSVYLQLCEILGIAEYRNYEKILDPSVFIPRFSNRLLKGGTHDGVVLRTARDIIASMKRDWIQTGRKLDEICGAALFTAAISHGIKCSEGDTGIVVHLCSAAAIKRVIGFGNTETGSSNVDELTERERAFLAMKSKSNEDGLLCVHQECKPFGYALCQSCYNDFITVDGFDPFAPLSTKKGGTSCLTLEELVDDWSQDPTVSEILRVIPTKLKSGDEFAERGFGTTLSGEICFLLGEATKRAKEAYVQIDALNQTGDLRLGHAQIEILTAIATLVNASDRVNTVEREKTEQAMPP